MKKNLFSLLAFLLLFSFNSCNKEEESILNKQTENGIYKPFNTAVRIIGVDGSGRRSYNYPPDTNTTGTTHPVRNNLPTFNITQLRFVEADSFTLTGTPPENNRYYRGTEYVQIATVMRYTNLGTREYEDITTQGPIEMEFDGSGEDIEYEEVVTGSPSLEAILHRPHSVTGESLTLTSVRVSVLPRNGYNTGNSAWRLEHITDEHHRRIQTVSPSAPSASISSANSNKLFIYAKASRNSRSSETFKVETLITAHYKTIDNTYWSLRTFRLLYTLKNVPKNGAKYTITFDKDKINKNLTRGNRKLEINRAYAHMKPSKNYITAGEQIKKIQNF